jgi:ribosomal protein S4E
MFSGQEHANNGTSQYTVLPTRKKAREPEKISSETKKLKPKKNNMKKKWKSKKLFLKKHGHQENVTREEATDCDGCGGPQMDGVAMSDSTKLVKEESRKSNFVENQVCANCDFKGALVQIRAVPDGENWSVGSNVMETT